MENKIYMLMKIGTYLALLPFVFRILLAIDLSKYFRRNREAEIKLTYLFLTIITSKIVGDFIIDIMDLLRTLFGLNTF